MGLYYATHDDFGKFLRFLAGNVELYTHAARFDDHAFVRYPSEQAEEAVEAPQINLKGNRTRESIKAFFFDARETVATFPEEAESSLMQPVQRAIVGLKACDLRSLNVLDSVFLESEPVDPFYKLRREGTILITADCVDFGESCFCNLHGEKPHSETESGFDLNLSAISKGILVEVGSEKGEQLIEDGKAYFKEASDKELEERTRQREETSARLMEQNQAYAGKTSFYDRIVKNMENPIWHSLSHRCVGCCGCLSICPTCHCFLLVDRKREEYYERERVWDFCIYPRYARVAGGANPRPELYERLRNRFIKKFQFFKEKKDFYACVGCGRCSDVCPADIEIREVLKELG